MKYLQCVGHDTQRRGVLGPGGGGSVHVAVHVLVLLVGPVRLGGRNMNNI